MSCRLWAAALLVAMGLVVGCKKKPKVAGDAGSSGATPAATTPQGGAVVTGEGTVVWPVADLRASPQSGAALVAKLEKGKRVIVLERREGWSHVRAVDGKAQGWVVSESVEGGIVLGGGTAAGAAPVAKAAPARIRVDKKKVNLRDTANGRKIGDLARGTTMNVVRDEGKWLEVEGGGKRGWVARSVVTVLPPAVAAPPAAAATGAMAARAQASTLGSGTVKFKTLNVRDKPDGDKISELSRGTRVTLVREHKARELWLEVRSDDGKAGWVVARAIERIAAAPAAAPAMPAEGAPSAIGAAPGGATGRVTFKGVNLRKSAPKGDVLTTLKQGDTVTILAKRGAFLHVRAGALEGYVIAKAIAANAGDSAPTPAATKTAPKAEKPARHPDDEGDDEPAAKGSSGARVYAVAWTNVNMRRGPSMKAEMIDKLARGTKVRELDAEGNWVKIETVDAQQRRGWVSKKALQLAASKP
jgi:uncharacterized protein YgiM (DUF1202 family)